MPALDDNSGREGLIRWRAAQPANFYSATPNLTRVLALHAGAEPAAAMAERLSAFGAVVARELEPRVASLELHPELPALRPCDEFGVSVEEVEFDPAYDEIGRAIWRSGILAVQAQPGGVLEQAALGYLLAHAGEAGHTCPVACTAGLIRALQQYGSAALRDRFLPSLLEPDYDRCERGAQFLTEVQGGSDVGANVACAEPDPAAPGAFRISGEKWFCSVADADQFLLTARPAGAAAGTEGLACFLVPRRRDDGRPNGFHLVRLKRKLGTRAMATAEIVFDRAQAWPIGKLEDGIAIAVGVVLNTSRWFNAVAAAAVMRRAYLCAAGYARHREAFGQSIAAFPATRAHLAVMKAEEQAAFASTMDLTALVERIDRGVANADERAAHRILVNANKFATSIAATRVVHRAIEVLGGNGTVEDFSPLPRLYRDTIVLESWEGAHNVLCAQVLRDLQRLELLDVVLERQRARLGSLPEGPWRSVAGVVGEVLDGLAPRLRRSVDDEAFGALHFRRQLTELMQAWQAVCLLREAAACGEAEPEAAATKTALAAFFVRRHLAVGYDPELDPGASSSLDAVLAGDA